MGSPLFFLGSSPSQAWALGQKADGVMVSVNTLAERKSDFRVRDWIMDSGAFTRIASGHRHLPVELYAKLIQRWSRCGNLLAAVAQDWMCEAVHHRAHRLVCGRAPAADGGVLRYTPVCDTGIYRGT